MGHLVADFLQALKNFFSLGFSPLRSISHFGFFLIQPVLLHSGQFFGWSGLPSALAHRQGFLLIFSSLL
jgi:hypothetical protein